MSRGSARGEQVRAWILPEPNLASSCSGTLRAVRARRCRAWPRCVLAACSSTKSAEKLLNPDPPDKMYLIADALLTRGRYEDAAQKFEDLDRDHPYSPEARRAIVMSAFAYYKAAQVPRGDRHRQALHDDASRHEGSTVRPSHHRLVVFRRHERPQPRPGQYAQGAGGVQDADRRAIPKSTYAKAAENKIRLCEDSLAAHEMYVGMQYLKNKQWLAPRTATRSSCASTRPRSMSRRR